VVAVLGLALLATKSRADAAADEATARAVRATETTIGGRRGPQPDAQPAHGALAQVPRTSPHRRIAP
jgi:hypothetical protein